MTCREHPQPDLLLRFLRGEISRTDRLEVVRHLLTGCPDCVAVTREAWHLPSRLSVIREAAREETELNAV
jgi:anti-sigma factor RsiW